MGNKLNIIAVIYYIAVKQTFDCNHILKEKGIMSRVKLFVVSLFLFSFMLCMLGVPTQAQIGPGGDMPGAGGNTIGAGGNTPGAGGNTIGAGGDGPSDGLLTLTPLVPIGPRNSVNVYEVFNATPGGEVFIIRGFEEGERSNLICLMINLDIIDFELENILVADELGYASSTINVRRIGPRNAETLYMQAIDLEECTKSNLTEYDL